jgi:hypothetical protein
MATFGVLTIAISAMANGMTFSATTRPSTAQVETWIDQASNRASSAIRAANADPDTVALDATGEGYSLAAQYVTADVASLAVAAMDRRDTQLAETFRRRAADLLRDLREWAGALGNQRVSSEGTPGLVEAEVMFATDQLATRDASYWKTARGQL